MIIEQDEFTQLQVETFSKDFIPFVAVKQGGDNTCLDRQGAKQLIKVLQEIVDEHAMDN